jgi:hypothetical protein
MDATDEDAVLTFHNSTSKAWTSDEIERVDKAFAILHQATGNTALLKMRGGDSLDFTRVAKISSDTATSTILGENRGYGRISLTDAGLSGHETKQVGTVLHEIGHNWDDENPNWSKFLEKSGWTQSNPDPEGRWADRAQRWWGGDAASVALEEAASHGVNDPPYRRIDRYNSTWWYKASTPFVSSYARTHPSDDFAESFAAYFIQKAGRNWADYRSEGGRGAADIPDKAGFIEALVKGL